MRRFLLPSCLAMVGLFLVDASYPLSFFGHRIVRLFLILSALTAISTVVSLLVHRQPVTFSEPRLPRLSFKEKIAQVKKQKETQDDDELRRERLAYQRGQMVKKLAKAHDIPFYTTQHLKVQQNMGFLKKK